MNTEVLSVFLLCAAFNVVHTARILGVFPQLGKSHFIMFEPMMRALAARGHEVVVISQFPLKNPPPNYTDIDVSSAMNVPYVNALPVDINPGEYYNLFSVYALAEMSNSHCEKILDSKPVADLLKSNQKFDLVFYEVFVSDCFMGFVHRFKAIPVAVASSCLMTWGSWRFGLPDNPSYIANHFIGFSDRMNVWQRTLNSVYYVISHLAYPLLTAGTDAAVARKHFGEDVPPLYEIAKNTSIFFINTHFSLNQVRPLTPNVIEVGGIHVTPPGKLDKDLQSFLDNAKEGVVYFCLGSTARGSTLPLHIRDAFIKVFSKLPHKVLWKWEDEELPDKPSNVKIVKWLPQTAVLAHPNVKLFITHGGLMGMLEAVHFGVPMITIPLFGDQFNNVGMAVKRGIAVKLSLFSITEEALEDALNKVLKDPSYSERAKQVSRAFHDRPLSPVDSVIYWTEYVLKFNGAPHLRSASVDLPFAQYLLLDVIVILSVISLSILFFVVLACKYCCGRKQSSKRSSKQKQK